MNINEKRWIADNEQEESMNTKTGAIVELASVAPGTEGEYILLDKPPKESCRKCCGRGYEGTNDQGERVPCTCVLSRNRR